MPGHHDLTGKSIYLFSFTSRLPLLVRFLFALGGADLGVSQGCEKLLAADLADLLALVGSLPFA
jgi:hypothetical protein